jgi:hypothetical protein
MKIFVHFLKTLMCRECAKHVFLFFKFSGRCPETHSLFAKSEAKTLIRVLRIPAQSAETTVSAGGAGAEPPQILCLHNLYTSAFSKSGGVRGGTPQKGNSTGGLFLTSLS